MPKAFKHNVVKFVFIREVVLQREDAVQQHNLLRVSDDFGA